MLYDNRLYLIRVAVQILLFVVLLAGCVGEKEKPSLETPKKEVLPVMEPFLAPEVENVSGGERFEGEKAAVRDLIINYNTELINSQIYMENLEKLRRHATKKEFIRMNASIEKDRVEGKIMSCTLRSLKFIKITVKGESGSVKTSEDWFFEDRDMKTGAVITPYRDYSYEVEYRVVKREGEWLVDSLDLKKAGEYMPPRGKPRRVNVNTSFSTR